MTAPTKNWTSIPDSALDEDSPLDETLKTAERDNAEHLRQWLGGSFTPAQDHNHDGVNSAAIEVGPNYLRNGGFESGLAGWESTPYTGGTVATGASNEAEGITGLVITSTVAANGGGKVESSFIPVTASQVRQFQMVIKASGATVPIKAEALWYDDTEAAISASTIISVTASPTGERLVIRRIAAPSTAKYVKVRLELPTGAGGTGSIYFDDVFVGRPAMLGGQQVFTANGTFSAVWGDVYARVQGAGAAGGGNGGTSTNGPGGGGGAGGYAEGPITISADVSVVAGTGTCSFSTISATAGTTGSNGTGSGVPGLGGAAGTGSGGAINTQGSDGQTGSPGSTGTGGQGGTSPLGGGGYGGRPGSLTGASGNGYGGGGGGGGADGATGSTSGGSGTQGVVSVEW